jgi:hypothetical protein
MLATILAAGMSFCSGVLAADCSAEIAEIERRVSTGDYPEQNVQIARQIQASLDQMCDYLDANAKAAMLEGLEELLPTKSEDERQAERDALRDAGDNAPGARVAASPALPPPTARIVAARLVERDEDMLRLSIADWDAYRGKARVLYVTMPSRTQIGRPDWQVYVYVVEIGPDGSAVQHRVTGKQAMDNRAVALRRGHDEILFERATDDGDEASTLERWSIPDGRLLSSAPTPKPVWPDGEQWPWQPFRVATADGNVLFVANKKSRAGVSSIGWFEASADGKVRGMGSLDSAAADLAAMQFFRTANGGGGAVVTIAARGDTGIPGPIDEATRGTMLRASVFSETRALVIADDAGSARESDALSRMLIWGGGAMSKPSSGADTMRRQQELMRRRTELENEYHANRQIETVDVGMQSVPMIVPMRRGYGALATVSADRTLRPPVHGPYFLRIENGSVGEAAYLEPVAEALDVNFEILAVSPDDDAYVYGKPAGRNDGGYVVKLDAGGGVQGYGRTAPHDEKAVTIEGMTADTSGVWLFGTQTLAGTHQRFWFERLAF